MSDTTAAVDEQNTPLDRTYSAIATVSKYVTFIAIIAMMVVMVVEVFMRYFAQQPLGWNISLIENVLMPGLVFLGLPYAYSVGAHVAAELVYDRVSPKAQRVLDWLGRCLLVLCSVFLAYAGMQITVTTYLVGEIPPPLSSEILIPVWVWRTFLPVGALMMLVLVLIDAVRPSKQSGSAS